MAQRVHVVVVDDIDGSDNAETVRFGLDGVDYEIDLGSANAEKLRADLQTWVAKARRVGGRKQMKKTGAGRSATELAAIRDWARKNGMTVSDRGRISAEIVAKYDAAN
ncbi:MAG: histone-like nucleoid-structuring protein Lsr2 [Propionibacteriaceae bacterium]